MGWIITRQRNHPNGDIITRVEDTPGVMQTLMRNFIIHGQTTEILGYVDGEDLNEVYIDVWNAISRQIKARDKQYD